MKYAVSVITLLLASITILAQDVIITIDIYNSKYDQAAVQLRWSICPNGEGLALAF